MSRFPLPVRRVGALLALALLWCAPLPAVEKIRVVALFPNKAMVEVDGQRRTLTQGERSPEGMLLLSCDYQQAVIEVNGKEQTLKLSSQIGGSFTSPTVQEVRIPIDASGAFSTPGAVNGQRVEMIVDTGATLVALSGNQAKTLKIDYKRPERLTQVQTAAGNKPAYQVSLDKVKVGAIELAAIPGVVIEGNDPPQVLLGMSFLSKIKMEHAGNVMVLKSR